MKCTFCGETIPPGTGKIFVEKSGKTRPYCSTKCEKNFIKLKRNPTHIKWSKHYKKE